MATNAKGDKMKYTLSIQYRNGKKATTPRCLSVSLATLARKNTLVAFRDSGEFVAAVITDPKITMMRDGILVDGYEDGRTTGAYLRQQWWLTSFEVTK